MQHRLSARAVPEGDCLLYMGASQSKGYSSIWVKGRGMLLAHRVAWELQNGPIPDDLTIDHVCESKRCIRVEHMQLVTREENQRLRWVRWAERKAVA